LNLFTIFSSWIGNLFFGTAVKSAGKGALRKSPFSFHAPNLLLSIIVIIGINIANFLVMFIYKLDTIPVLFSSGIVTIITAFFVLRGVRSKHALKERIALFTILVIFFGIFVFCVIIADWLWLGWIAKLTLELLLCFAIMLTNKNKIDNAQSKIMAYILKLLKISPHSRLGKTLNKIDSQTGKDDADK
jgi:hypothetical protein